MKLHRMPRTFFLIYSVSIKTTKKFTVEIKLSKIFKYDLLFPKSLLVKVVSKGVK